MSTAAVRDAARPAAVPRSWTVLCVDDEPNILAALCRVFRRSGHRLLTATSGAEALQVLGRETVHLVISDMRMPSMDGAQLLERVRAGWPAVTRILLTGHADVGSTVSAINRGEIFRYIAKPWNDDALLHAADEGLERQALVAEKSRLERAVSLHNGELRRLNGSLEQQVAERTCELSQANADLDRNYLGSITALSNLMELRSGVIAGHSRRVADLARRMAVIMALPSADTQDVFVAGLLHDIGHVGLSDAVLGCTVTRMSARQREDYARHASVGEQSLVALRDMGRVALLVRSHHERHDGRGFPDGLRGDSIPVGSRILAVADAFDDLHSGRLSSEPLSAAKIDAMIAAGRNTQFDSAAVDACLMAKAQLEPARISAEIAVDVLLPGMVLAADLRSTDGVVLLAAGLALDEDLVQRIRRYAVRHGPGLRVLVVSEAPGSSVLPFRTLA